MVAELIAAGILALSDGNYSFRYPSYYYFFVARHLKDGIADPIRFGNAKHSAPFPSAIVIFRPITDRPVQLSMF